MRNLTIIISIQYLNLNLQIIVNLSVRLKIMFVTEGPLNVVYMLDGYWSSGS